MLRFEYNIDPGKEMTHYARTTNRVLKRNDNFNSAEIGCTRTPLSEFVELDLPTCGTHIALFRRG